MRSPKKKFEPQTIGEVLDDIFDKLDQNRVSQTIKLFENESIGQIFISDTHEDRIKLALSSTSSKYEIFNLN